MNRAEAKVLLTPYFPIFWRAASQAVLDWDAGSSTSDLPILKPSVIWMRIVGGLQKMLRGDPEVDLEKCGPTLTFWFCDRRIAMRFRRDRPAGSSTDFEQELLLDDSVNLVLGYVLDKTGRRLSHLTASRYKYLQSRSKGNVVEWSFRIDSAAAEVLEDGSNGVESLSAINSPIKKSVVRLRAKDSNSAESNG